MWATCFEGPSGDGCQPGYSRVAGGAGLSPSGASPQMAEGACATKEGAASLVLSLVTQKRDRWVYEGWSHSGRVGCTHRKHQGGTWRG